MIVEQRDGIVSDSRGLLFAASQDVQVSGVTVNTKTLDSHERAKKQHADDLKLLSMLEAIPSLTRGSKRRDANPLTAIRVCSSSALVQLPPMNVWNH